MKKHLLISKGLIVVLTFALTLSTAAFTPAQAQNQSAPVAYQTLLEKARQEGKAREMTLTECIELALKKNLSIEISHYQPLLSQQSLNAALGVYDFTLSGSTGYSKTERPSSNIVDVQAGILTYSSKTFNFNTTLARALPTGGTASVTFSGDRVKSTYSIGAITYDGNLLFNVTQPLWKNFTIDANRRQILNSKKDVQISETDFEKSVADVVLNVENQYWDLINAIEQQKIQIQRRELLAIQLRDNQRRVEVGTIAPITVTQTKSDLAAAEQSVIQAEATIILAENTMKDYIVNDAIDPLWSQFIIPTDKPEIPAGVPPVEDALKTAVQKRPEVRKLNIQLKKNDTDLKYYKNQTRPQFDLRMSYNSYGTSSPDLSPNVPISGGWGKSYEEVFQQKYRGYSFTLNFTYIIGNRAAKAGLASASIDKDLNLATLKSTLQGIQVEVVNDVQTIEVNRKSLEAAVASRQLYEEQLDGQTKRFQAGLVTNFEVLQTQSQLAQARATELQNRINLKKAFVALQRATFTNLDQYKLDVVHN